MMLAWLRWRHYQTKLVEVAGPPTISHVLPFACATLNDSGEVQRLFTQVAQLAAQVQALTCSLQ